MSLTEIASPVQDAGAFKYNCFKGYVPTFFELQREDIQISNLTSQVFGGELLLKVQVVGSLEASQNIGVGDKIVINSDEYPNTAATIVDVIIADEVFVVDVAYIVDDATGFVNYKKNWFVEYRIVKSDTVADAQTEVANLFDFVFTSQSETTGKVELDISVANNKNSPSVEVGLNNDMFLFFRIQWRELYLGFTGAWVSPADNDAMIVYHASDPTLQEGGIDTVFQNTIMLTDPTQVRFWNDESPKLNFLRSRLGDDDPTRKYKIRVLQYDVTKFLLASNDVEIPNIDGVHTVDLSSIAINSSTVFITFETLSVLDGGEYEEQEYQDDEYNVTT